MYFIFIENARQGGRPGGSKNWHIVSTDEEPELLIQNEVLINLVDAASCGSNGLNPKFKFKGAWLDSYWWGHNNTLYGYVEGESGLRLYRVEDINSKMPRFSVEVIDIQERHIFYELHDEKTSAKLQEVLKYCLTHETK
jgi:hypothetical protein